MAGAVAEFERALLLERQREGIAIAKTKGKYKGRVPSLTDEQAEAVVTRLADGESASALAREYGVSRATIYNTRTRQPWTEPDTIAADDLYLQLGSKRLHATHPKVIALADRLGRTPTAVAAQIDNLHHAHSGNRWRCSQQVRKVADRELADR
jgi:hypothetical protein